MLSGLVSHTRFCALLKLALFVCRSVKFSGLTNPDSLSVKCWQGFQYQHISLPQLFEMTHASLCDAAALAWRPGPPPGGTAGQLIPLAVASSRKQPPSCAYTYVYV